MMKIASNIYHNFHIPNISANKFQILPLTQKDLNESLHVVYSKFNNNALLSALGIPSQTLMNFLRIGFERSMDENLGFICKDSEESKIIGCITFLDQYHLIQNPMKYDETIKSTQASININEDSKSESHNMPLLQLNKSLIATKPNQILYNSYIAINSGYSASIITKEFMNFFTNQHVIGSKASLIYRECISKSNEKLFKKLGWKKLVHLNWNDIIQSNQTIELDAITKQEKYDGISLMGYMRS